MKKTLQDLTIKDNFMFGAVMTYRKYRKKYDLSSRVQRRPS